MQFAIRLPRNSQSPGGGRWQQSHKPLLYVSGLHVGDFTLSLEAISTSPQSTSHGGCQSRLTDWTPNAITANTAQHRTLGSSNYKKPWLYVSSCLTSSTWYKFNKQRPLIQIGMLWEIGPCSAMLYLTATDYNITDYKNFSTQTFNSRNQTVDIIHFKDKNRFETRKILLVVLVLVCVSLQRTKIRLCSTWCVLNGKKKTKKQTKQKTTSL